MDNSFVSGLNCLQISGTTFVFDKLKGSVVSPTKSVLTRTLSAWHERQRLLTRLTLAPIVPLTTLPFRVNVNVNDIDEYIMSM